MMLAIYESSIWLQCLWFICGLMIGSFVNVVIYRLPLMIKHEHHGGKTFNLMFPRSHCRSCQQPLRFYENIPIISFLILFGRCSHCRTRISFQYPFVEITTALLFSLAYGYYGLSIKMMAVIVFLVILLTLTIIDLQHQLLPDILTLLLLWAGLLANSVNMFIPTNLSIYGAAAGYMSLWVVYWLFKIITGKEGLGYGDFKLLAALGAWCGWKALTMIIFISSLLGSIVGLIMIFACNKDRYNPIAFGPFLAIAGIAVFFGNDLLMSYWHVLFRIS